MPGILQKLGIDWKLLLSQGINFLILLVLLTFLLYKPLLRIMHERKRNIEKAVEVIKEAENKISEAELIQRDKIALAENKAITIIKTAEQTALVKSNEIIAKAKSRSAEIIKEAENLAERRKLESLEGLMNEAKNLVRDILVKTIVVKPEHVDERLISQAIETIRKEKNL